MKITTWNVNGIRAREAQVGEWLGRERPDVLCLQEIKASPADVPSTLCGFEGYWCYWHGHKGYSGVALMLSKQAFSEEPRYTHPAFDHEHRIVMVTVGDLTFASIYVPNGGKDYPAKLRFLEALVEYAREAHQRGERLILCGDLNVARTELDVHPSLRKPEQIGQRAEERALIEALLSHGLVDLSRQFEPDNDRLFTWWAPWRSLREKNVGWRLDYVLPSKSLAQVATSCTAHRDFGTSDHGPVTAHFDAVVPRVELLPQAFGQQPAEAEPSPPAGQLTFDLGASSGQGVDV